MDWSKAKTILIVALLVVNLILASIYIIEREREREYELSKSELIDKLSEKDILLNADIPNGESKLRELVVEYELYNANDINFDFFNGEGTINKINEDLFEVYMQNETVTVINGKLLIYEAEKTDSNQKSLYSSKIDLDNSLENAQEIALNFLKDRGFRTDDMKITFSTVSEDGYYLLYSNTYGDNFVESSFTNFEIKDGKVFRMERTWLDVKNEGESILKTLPAKKALLELLMREEVYGKEIIDISICYYFDPEKQDYFSRYKEVVEGKTIPAWRVQFSDGYKIILDFE
ncbi:MAG: hypothetical protein H5T96_06605 [Tissierellales bacterium]|nr:hypothetical protein [Tissierellales bacterium]